MAMCLTSSVSMHIDLLPGHQPSMICINNILSAKAVMNMAHVPGEAGRGGGVTRGRGYKYVYVAGSGALRQQVVLKCSPSGHPSVLPTW
jgi:hypothetical protein